MGLCLHAEVVEGETHTLVRLTGVLDAVSAPAVRTTLLKCLAEQPATLLVHLAGLTVAEPSALAVFTAAHRQATIWPDTPLLLCAPPPQVAALLASDAYGPLPVFGTAAAALAAQGRLRAPSVADELLPVTGAARQARDLATLACARWDVPHLTGPASIVVSELVSNTVRHAHTMMTLRLTMRGRYLHIALRDGCPEQPRPAAGSPLDPGTGRGLLLVDALADRWGSLPTDGGKVVWAVLRNTRTG